MTREPKLKACPFCGHGARYAREGEAWQADGLWTAGCIYGHANSPGMDTLAEAAEWWNRRSKPFAVRALSDGER